MSTSESAVDLSYAGYERILCGVVVSDGAGIIRYINPAARTMFGLSPEQGIGTTQLTPEATALAEDGSVLPLEYHPYTRAVRTGLPLSGVVMGLHWPSDDRLIWLLADISPVLDEHGRLRQVVASFYDVTSHKQMEQELRRTEERYRRIVETAQEGIYLLDANDRVVYVNQKMADMLGYSIEEMLGMYPIEYVAEEQRADAVARHQARLQGERSTSQVESKLRRKDGSYLWALVSSTALFDDEGRYQGLFGMETDITGRKQAEHALQEREAWYRALAENATDLVTVLDEQGSLQYLSPSYRAVLGYEPDQEIGRPVTDFIHPEDIAAARQQLAASLTRVAAPISGEYRILHRDGSWRWMESVSQPLLGHPTITGVVVNSRDITERKQAEEALRRMALYDALTGLPNRTLLLDRLDQALLAAQQDSQSLALLLLDLNHFREVNDTFGHQYGDELLKDVANRLHAAVRAADTIARLGGDEFALVLSGTDAAGAVQAIDIIRAALEHPIAVGGQHIQVRASIGIALGPAQGADSLTLLQRADVAMYTAKRADELHATYAPEHDYHSPDRLALMADLHYAAARNELALYYQPKVEMASDRLCGVEALLRWRHPTRGLVPPDHFIPLAEQIGAMPALTQWVLEAAIGQCRIWQRQGLHMPVAVNLAAVNLRDADLPAVVARLLSAHDLPPSSLRLEVTESTLLADTARAQQVLTRLAAQGIAISVDDYGTGYSSLAYLQKLPVDELKIDRSFVRHLVENATDAIIVSSTIGLAHSLGLQVVAEGVEDRATWERLAELGCDIAQGYYLSRPVPAEEMAERFTAAGRSRI